MIGLAPSGVRCLALLFFLLAVPALAETRLEGRIEQGGLALGRTSPGAVVTLDGRKVAVDGEGRFLLGFAREAGLRSTLEIRTQGGTETHRLDVRPRRWDIQRIDGLPADKVTPDPAMLARIKAENELVAARRAVSADRALFREGLLAPAEGTVSGVFGSQRILNGEPRAAHSGTDIAAPIGTEVRAAGAGRVVLAHLDLFYTGLTVMIDHGLGLMSVYAHLSRIDVAEGQMVAAGQPIGAIGASGRVTGPHLHWGASWQDVRLDPETVLAVLGRQ